MDLKRIKLNEEKEGGKKIPAKRIRTTDLRITVSFSLYSPPLYQLSYHGIVPKGTCEEDEGNAHGKCLNFTAVFTGQPREVAPSKQRRRASGFI